MLKVVCSVEASTTCNVGIVLTYVYFILFYAEYCVLIH